MKNHNYIWTNRPTVRIVRSILFNDIKIKLVGLPGDSNKWKDTINKFYKIHLRMKRKRKGNKRRPNATNKITDVSSIVRDETNS
jgi:hypothetical protein